MDKEQRHISKIDMRCPKGNSRNHIYEQWLWPGVDAPYGKGGWGQVPTLVGGKGVGQVPTLVF